MKANIGTTDRVVRAALGLGLVYLAFFSGLPAFSESLARYGAAAVGIVLLATSALKLCPLYSILGFKTCKEC